MNAAPPTVLIVEDEAFVAWDIEQMVAGAGNTVAGPAASVDAALALVDDGGLDAAVLDINLGSDHVWPVADRLLDTGVPFGFVSANLSHPELAGRFAAAPRLSKPVLERDLVAMVAGLLRR